MLGSDAEEVGGFKGVVVETTEGFRAFVDAMEAVANGVAQGSIKATASITRSGRLRLRSSAGCWLILDYFRGQYYCSRKRDVGLMIQFYWWKLMDLDRLQPDLLLLTKLLLRQGPIFSSRPRLIRLDGWLVGWSSTNN